MKTFKENIKSNYGAFSSALGGESSDTLQSAYFFDTKYYDLIVGQLTYTKIGSGDTVTFKAWQSTATTGAGSKTITGASSTVLSAATTDTGVLVVQVRPWDLDIANSFRYVGFQAVTSNASGTECVSMAVLQANGRYAQATPPADR